MFLPKTAQIFWHRIFLFQLFKLTVERSYQKPYT